jgi:hypothetical protein
VAWYLGVDPLPNFDSSVRDLHSPVAVKYRNSNDFPETQIRSRQKGGLNVDLVEGRYVLLPGLDVGPSFQILNVLWKCRVRYEIRRSQIERIHVDGVRNMLHYGLDGRQPLGRSLKPRLQKYKIV